MKSLRYNALSPDYDVRSRLSRNVYFAHDKILSNTLKDSLEKYPRFFLSVACYEQSELRFGSLQLRNLFSVDDDYVGFQNFKDMQIWSGCAEVVMPLA